MFSYLSPTIFEGRNRENPQGKDFGGFKGNFEGMFEHTSLVKIRWKKARKTYVSLFS